MTSDTLRADADKRERLARAATPGPWRATEHDRLSAAVSGGRFGVSVAWCGGAQISTAQGSERAQSHADAALIANGDPAAALRQVERDRLLADAMDWIDRQERRDFSSPSKVPLGALLRRFAEMEAGDANM